MNEAQRGHVTPVPKSGVEQDPVDLNHKLLLPFAYVLFQEFDGVLSYI